MKKIVRRVILFVIMVVIIGVLKNIFFKKSEENGNIANMGLVVEADGIVYYNKYEKGIFSYKNGREKQLTDETAYSLTVAQDKIYYITVADFSNVVVKSVDLNGENLKNVATIYTSLSKFFIDEEQLYYLNNKGIVRLDLNGESEQIIVEENILDFQVVGKNIFYVNESHQISKCSISGEKNVVLTQDAMAKKLQIVDQWIYFYDENENALFRVSKNGKKKELVSVLVKNEIYNVSGKYVYYLNKENAKIARMKIGKSNQCDDLVSLNTANTRINIANKELYYLDKSQNEGQTYQIYRVNLKGEESKGIEY